MSNYWKKKLDELEKEKKNNPSGSYWDRKAVELKNEELRRKAFIKQKEEEEDDIAPIKSKEDDGKLDFFQKGAFEDGFDWSDIPKVISGTLGDVGVNLVKGAGSLVEGITDAGSYITAAGADALGKDKWADDLRKKTQVSYVDNLLKPWEERVDKSSILGRTSDAILQGFGQVGAIVGTGLVGGALGLGATGATALTSGIMGLSGVGSGTTEAYQSGANDLQALKHGLNSGAADAISELIFAGMGKTFNAVGFNKGLSNADDMLAKLAGSKFKNQTARNIVEFGIKSGAEGLEEVLAGVAQAYSKYHNYLEEQGVDFVDVLKDENLLEQFIVGSAVSGGMQSGVIVGTRPGSLIEANKTGSDFITGLNQNEQAVVKKEIENRIAEAEADGTKLTAKEKAAIEAQVEKDLEKGYISTDLIDEIVGGETYKAYKDSVDREDALFKEYEELGKTTNPTLAQQYRYRELDSRVKSIKDNDLRGRRKEHLDQFVSEQVNGSRLAESYNERIRRGQKFEADLTKYDAKQQAVIKKAVESDILNNTNRTHEFVDMVAKISADKGVLFDFTNNEKLKNSGFAVDGKTVNGYVTKDGITLNMDSSASRRYVVGHEITHVLEGTELYTELQNTIFEYAKTKGDYQGRFDSLSKLYEGIEGADINAELTADLVGEYLFTDTDFINNLSTNHRNVFQKIYAEVKYLLKVATAGSKEARQLEKVKRAFEKAYRENGKKQADTKYSVQQTTDGRSVAVVDSDILSNIDTSSWDDTKKAEAKKAAVTALKQFKDGIVVDGITRKVNRTSRREYTRSDDTERLFKQVPEVFADKMRAADAADDIVVATTNWQRDGGLKHPRTDNFVDFDHGKTLIVAGNAKYTAEVVVGITSSGDAVFYDVVDMTPATFDIKKEESPTTATTQNAIGDIKGDSSFDNVAQNGESVKYSLRQEAPPKNTGIAYKVFFVKDGKLYPPMVANPGGADTPMGVWLNADMGTAAPPSKTGRAQVKAGGKGTQGGGGSLAFRPGWHLGDLPRASQFDRVNPETGKKELFPENFVWAEVEYAKDVDYQEEAMSYGYTDNGKFRHAYAGLPRLPENGYYRYRTNPKPDTVPWVITGAMKVNRLLSDAEVNAILEKNGVPPVHRQGGDVGLDKFGFNDDGTVKYSLSAEQTDKNYLNAVKSEDMRTAQKMVDDAAKRWGAYLNNPEANEVFKQEGDVRIFYHGTNTGDFTSFDSRLLGSSSGDLGWFGKGFYFAFSHDEAATYGGRVIPAYLQMRNPFDYSQLYKFKGSDKGASQYSRFAWLYNITKQFPDIVKGQRVWAYPNNAEQGSSVSWEQLANWMDRIQSEKQFSVEKVELSNGETAYELRADPKKESYTNDDGETFEWTEYGMTQLFNTEKDANEPINQVGAYLENVLGIDSIPRRVIEKIDFSGALQRAGYDGILQSMSGDEAVVFSPEQIKTSEPVTYDDNGNVIPLSERFNPGNKDIRYSLSNAETDKKYLDAVNSGDTETARKIMEQVAKRRGYTIHAYHGTARGDRVGNVFLPERATSGPMAFFTDNKEIAENYSKSKQDTSLAYDSDYDRYETQFRIKVLDRDIPLYRAWGYLPFDARRRITQKAGQLRENWDGDNELILDPDTNEANGGFQWQLKEARGNAIQALTEQWLNSGNLFNEEGRFLDVLEMAGVTEEFKKVKGMGELYFKDPNAKHEKVYDTFLRIRKPFDTATVNEQFIADLEAWYEEQDESKYVRENMQSDMWDKNGIDAYNFADRLRSDLENNTTHAWTSIPDSVTDYLKHLGYDGIKDTGGKFTLEGHTVWIPFTSSQIKSAETVTYDDKGNVIPITERFDRKEVDIRKSISEKGEPTKAASDPLNELLYEAPVQEEIAPVVKNATPEVNNATPNATIAENATVRESRTVEEMFPDDLAPVQQELDNLLAEQTELRQALESAMDQGDYSQVSRLTADYEAVTGRIRELQAQEDEQFSSLSDADMPPEAEAPYPGEPNEMSDPFAERDIVDVGNRSVKAYQYENPEVKPFFTEAALGMLYDLRNGTKGEKIFNGDVYYQSGGEEGWMGTKRQTTADIAELLDTWNYTYDQIEKGLNAIIEDDGKENNAVSKRIEFMLNDRLMNGYTGVWGEQIPANQEYINLLNEKQITEYSREAFDRFMATADQYAPPAQAEDIAPVQQKTGYVSTGSEQMKLPLYHDPNNVSPAMAEVQADGDIAPVFETESGQQAIFPDADVPKAVTRKELHASIIDKIKTRFAERGFDLDAVLKNARNLSTFATVDNIPQRVMEKALGYKEGDILADFTVNKVAQNETQGIKWLNSFTDRKNGLLAQISKKYNIKPGSKESAAAQMYAEGFYVNKQNEIVKYGDRELAVDFPDVVKQAQIKGLARDPRIRKIYDDTLKAINESRTRNAYPEIPRLDNYFLHFRAMNDTFSKLGLPFNPNDIRAKDLPTDLNGVTADLKPGQPFFASAMHREGKRTDFDLLGGLEQYLTSAKNQIYHIDDIQNLRALRNYIADTYGQANGLEGLDALSEEEQQDRIEQVYGSHLSTFAKFLNEEANMLAGKTALIDRGLEGIIGRRGMTFLDTLNRQVGANMVGYNISSSLTNFLSPVQAFAKSNKADFIKGMAQFASNKVQSIHGNGDGFAEQSPVMIRRKGAERFHRTLWQKMADPGYVLMSAVDDISTEIIARAKYNELTRKGMDSQQAHIETDKWVSRLMGDRSLGQQPQLYNSKMLGIITKFQLEVRNQLDSQFYDTIQEAKVSNEDIQNGLLKNAKTVAKVGSTFFQLAVAQHLFGKAFESIAGYNPAFDIISAIIKTFGWDDDEEDEDTVLDNIEQGFFELMGDMPYVSTFTGGRIPIESALPIEELYKGKDQYGNEKSRWETLGEAAPYYLLPGGYGQIKKTVAGMDMFSDEHPIAGSYTDSGNLRFPVEDTLANRGQAAVFGQYASGNARDYFDNERSALKPKQIQEFIDVGMSIQDYWKYRDGLSGLSKLEEKINYINGLNLTTAQKNVLVNNLTDRKEAIDMTDYDQYSSLEEFDYANKNPEKYAFFEKIGITYETYRNADDDAKKAYDWALENPDKYPMSKAVASDVVEYRRYTSELYDIKADKDSSGKSISGSRKEKVLDYINSLDIDYGAKLILFKNEYNADDESNQEIIDYLNGRSDISFEEEVAILRELGFTVTSDGTIYWD